MVFFILAVVSVIYFNVQHQKHTSSLLQQIELLKKQKMAQETENDSLIKQNNTLKTEQDALNNEASELKLTINSLLN